MNYRLHGHNKRELHWSNHKWEKKGEKTYARRITFTAPSARQPESLSSWDATSAVAGRKSRSMCLLYAREASNASTVWDTHHTTRIRYLEAVQGKAARFVFNDCRSRTPGCVIAMLGQVGNLETQHLAKASVVLQNQEPAYWPWPTPILYSWAQQNPR